MRAIAEGLGVLTFVVFSWGANQVVGEPIKIVSPSMYADTEAPGVVNGITAEPDGRAQQVLLASDFASLPEGCRTITHIAMRPDGDVVGTVTGGLDNYTLRFSTTTAQPDSLSLTYSDNVGADETLVHEGPLTFDTVSVGRDGGPKEFSYIVELQTPFEYDPNKGNLLFDLTVNGYSGFPIDFDGSRKSTTAYLLNSDPLALTAEEELGGFPLQFTFVPEPSTHLLSLLALGAVGGWRKWKHAA